MGIIILVCVFVVLAMLGWTLLAKDGDNFSVLIFTTVTTLATLFSSSIAINKSVNLHLKFEVQITNYHSLKETIEYNRSSMSEFERAALISNIQEVNESINTHRIMHDSFWTGIWYSEEIGKLELLK